MKQGLKAYTTLQFEVYRLHFVTLHISLVLTFISYTHKRILAEGITQQTKHGLGLIFKPFCVPMKQ